MAEASVETKTIISYVTLSLSDREACALLYLLRNGAGGPGMLNGATLGGVMVAIQRAYDIGDYPDLRAAEELYARSGIVIEKNHDSGHVQVKEL